MTALTPISLAHGSDGSAVTDAERITALETLENMNHIPLQLVMDGGNSTDAYHSAMESLADSRLDECYNIFSVPYEVETDSNPTSAIQEYRTGTYSGYTLNLNTYTAGLYTPYQKVYDEFNDRYVYLPPDCFVAGAISKAATNYGYQYAAAGYNRGIINTIDVNTKFSPTEVDYFSDSQVNTIISDPGEGIVIIDQQTLISKPSDMQEQSVALMVNLDLRPSLRKYLKYFIFEINDDITRSAITAQIKSFMDTKKSARAVYDYRIICDTTNNTSDDIQNMRLNVDLYIKPTKPAKFINQKIIITPNAVQFAELLAA